MPALACTLPPSPWTSPGTWHRAPGPARLLTHVILLSILRLILSLSLIVHKGLSDIVSFSFLSLAFFPLSLSLVSSRLFRVFGYPKVQDRPPKTASSFYDRSSFPNAFPYPPPHCITRSRQQRYSTPTRTTLRPFPPSPPPSSSSHRLAFPFPPSPPQLSPSNVAAVPFFRHVQQPGRRGA